MKTVNRLFLLVAFAIVSSLCFAEEKPNREDFQDPGTNFEWQVGDTIMIKKDVDKYLTGQKPSKWVYYVQRTIQQVGTKRFPNGLLISGIYSWISKDAVLLKNPVDRATLEERKAAAEKKAADQAAIKALEEEAKELGLTVEELEAKRAEEARIEAERQAAEAARLRAEEEARQAALLAAQEEQEKTLVPKTGEENDSTLHSTMYNAMFPFHRFTIGLRGGVASLMHDAEPMGNWKAGFDGLLDLQYAYYFGAKSGKKVNCGILTGVGVGWAQSGLQNGVDTEYTVFTPDGTIDYKVSAENVKEQDGQLQVEVPIMFTMITEKGFFFNVGPKVIAPVFTHYNQGITAPHINATFVEEGVSVGDEVITGKVQNDQMNTKGKWNASKLNVMLTAELGYEWLLKKSGNSIGLGAYANYSVYDLYKNTLSNKSLIDVTAPSAAAPAQVDVNSATDTYAKGLGYFDCGLKLAFHFNFFKK